MAMNPDDTQTHTEHALPCGRSVEQVWEDMQVGRCTAHAADCPHCATARASLEQLAEATRLLVADPVGPPPGLLDRIMAAVRAELVQGEAISLPAPAGGVDISTLALAAVLRFAVDGVDGVRAHRCRIQPDPTTTDTVRVWMSVSLHYRSGQVGALEEARRRVRAVLSARIGVALGALDLEVADVWDDAATASEGWS